MILPYSTGSPLPAYHVDYEQSEQTEHRHVLDDYP